MTTEGFLSSLELAWKPARAIGALGGVEIEKLRDHAVGFVPAAFRVDSPIKCLDIGSGVGLPGIFLAAALPESQWTLVDSSERRCEIAAQAVAAVGLEQRVNVVHDRADVLARSKMHRRSYDLVASRLFGAMSETIECGLPLLKIGGSLVVSCLGEMVSSWQAADLGSVGGRYRDCWTTDNGVYVRLEGVEGLDDRFPRQPASRRRSPLFSS